MINGSPHIAVNLQEVHARIAEAALRAGRDPTDVQLVAVTKTFPVEAILEAYAAGQRDFGENRPEEGAEKIPLVGERLGISPINPVWHMIGHIQSRKADLVIAHFDVVHAVDRMKLAARLSQLAHEAGRQVPVLLECNVSGEASKYGYTAAGWETDSAVRQALRAEVAQVVRMPGLRVEGLMTVAPIGDDVTMARRTFASLRGLRDYLREEFPDVDWTHLSMGMSDDFEAAIAEGATLVRIGRAIFGART